jgi:hypothetical protein
MVHLLSLMQMQARSFCTRDVPFCCPRGAHLRGPTLLFCNPCRRLDNAATEHKTKLLKMDTLPQYYQCTAGHTSRAFPTALAPVKSVMKKRERKKREQAPDEGYEMSSMVDVKHDHVDEDLDADLDVKEQQVSAAKG